MSTDMKWWRPVREKKLNHIFAASHILCLSLTAKTIQRIPCFSHECFMTLPLVCCFHPRPMQTQASSGDDPVMFMSELIVWVAASSVSLPDLSSHDDSCLNSHFLQCGLAIHIRWLCKVFFLEFHFIFLSQNFFFFFHSKSLRRFIQENKKSTELLSGIWLTLGSFFILMHILFGFVYNNSICGANLTKAHFHRCLKKRFLHFTLFTFHN